MSKKQQRGSNSRNRRYAIMRCLCCGQGIVGETKVDDVVIWHCKGVKQKDGTWRDSCGYKVYWYPGQLPKATPCLKKGISHGS